jgi:hypothetical protein
MRQSSPGVSFAPRSHPNPSNKEELAEGWNPLPRRSQSQRVGKKEENLGRGRGLGNGGSDYATTLSYGGGNGEREEGEKKRGRGVTLEDKPLSRLGEEGGGAKLERKTTLQRASHSVRRAVEKMVYVPPAARVDGEKRVLILVADGSEEIEVL